MAGIGLVVAATLLYVSSNHIASISKKDLKVKPFDSRGLFVGEKFKPDDHLNHVDKEIDYVWDQIHLAGVADKEGNLNKAAEYYEKGFYGLSGDMENIIPGRSVSAAYLIDVYKKLGRREEALKILEILEKKVFKGDAGEKKAAEIRALILSEN